MSLETVIARLIAAQTGQSGPQSGQFVTPVTSAPKVPLRLKAAPSHIVPCVTSVTPKKINEEGGNGKSPKIGSASVHAIARAKSMTICAHCGPVFLFRGAGLHVGACPFCSRNPPQAAQCDACQHFSAPKEGASGSCVAGGPCSPHATLLCGQYRPKTMFKD